MEADLNIMEKVTLALTEKGYKATLEYPGFIEVLAADHLRLDFGTANDTWGCDVYGPDSDGVAQVYDVAADAIPADCQDVKLISEALVTTIEDCKKVDAANAAEEKLERVREKAADAFWAVVAEAYPENDGGDFPFDADLMLTQAMDASIKCWVAINVTHDFFKQ